MSRKKRETTRWRSKAIYKSGDYIRAGRVFNVSHPAADIIRYQIKSSEPGGSVDFACTIDEAIMLVACLTETIACEVAQKTATMRSVFR